MATGSVEDDLVILMVTRRRVDRNDVEVEARSIRYCEPVTALGQRVGTWAAQNEGEGLAHRALRSLVIAGVERDEGQHMGPTFRAEHLADVRCEFVCGEH